MANALGKYPHTTRAFADHGRGAVIADLTRRRVLQSAGIVVATASAAILPVASGFAHEGHDEAPKTILDLKGKLVRIVRPGEPTTGEFIQDRVTIRVDAQDRILDLRYG